MSRIPETPLNQVAIDEAKVYRGQVIYHDGESLHELDRVLMVEVGEWRVDGDDSFSPATLLTSGQIATLLGFRTEIQWLCTEETGERKLLMTPGEDENGDYQSFSEEEALALVTAINHLLMEAIKVHRNLAQELSSLEQ